MASGEPKKSLLITVKQLSSKVSGKKRFFLLSWFVVIPLVLTGAFLFMQLGLETSDDETNYPVTEFDHPGPQVYHYSPAAEYPIEECAECHEDEVPTASCPTCHNPLVEIETAVGNVSFPHHDPSIGGDPAPDNCWTSKCHNSTDSRIITEREASHAYCGVDNGCHDIKHERDTSSSASSANKDDFDLILIPILSAPITIALVLFKL